ncbi:hypothetical protein BH11PLA2_BH11PLA2_01610 [soil metagenome]
MIPRLLGVVLLAGFCLVTTHAQLPSPKANAAKTEPKLEAVAETKLLMNGLIEANFNGLTKTLKDKPAEAEAWQFARGQALLIAEGGNLLMLRAPKTKPAQENWLAKSQALRDAGVKLADAATKRDYLAARTAMAGLANSCNRCHEAQQVKKVIEPFADK